MLGPISLHVTDSYDGGEGMLDVRLLGLPLQRKRGPELARGEALRYLEGVGRRAPRCSSQSQSRARARLEIGA